MQRKTPTLLGMSLRQHAADAEIGAANVREAERGVERRLHLRARARVVDQQRAVVAHRDGDFDRDRRVGEAVAVDVIGEARRCPSASVWISARVMRSA